MRVYELAKESNVTSADVLRAAASCGIDVSSAISTIDAGNLAAVRKAVSEQGPSAALARRTEKAARAAALRTQGQAEENAALAEHLHAAEVAYAARPTDRMKLPEEKKVVPPAPQPKPAESKPEPVPAQATPVQEKTVEEKPVEEKAAVAAPKPEAVQPKAAPVAPPVAKPAAPKPAAPAAAAPKPILKPISINPKKPQIKLAPISINPNKKPQIRVGAPAGATAQPFPRTGPGAVKITVASQPKVRPPKPVDYEDDERGTKKGKKGREGQKAFDKLAANHAAPASAAPSPTSRISVNAEAKEISIRGAVIVKDLAAQLNVKPNRLIADLMALKILASINQRVEPDIATQIAAKYGYKVVIEHTRNKDAAARPVLKAIDADDLIPEDPPESLKPRPPVVTFLGHVDHGKTTLMDYIRKEHVAQGEAGGITQQISAYQVDVAGKKITFLDTPGHAAFSAMRARGARITDIAVLIIAADDGIMPQTEECIKVARQAGVQILVAITKCDKPTANVDRVKQQLQKRGLTPEDWGGDIICCPVSGVTGEGVDSLLENILVQAEVLELQANPNRRANGYVIESELQQGLGPCATLLVEGGTLKVGDAILIGEHFGKVRALIDDRGRRIKEAPPSTPVKCTGLSGVPEAGAEFRVMLDEKRARTLAEETARERKEEELSSSKATTLDALMSRMAAEGRRELNVIVKSDTQGSLEAIVEALGQIKSEKVGLNVIGTGTGNVSLTDVKKAAAGKAIIVGFDISNDSGVQSQARHDGVRIASFRIIYELLDYVKQCMLDLIPAEFKEVVLGHAEIKAIYDIGKLGKIAGSQMLDGRLVAKEKYRILRKGEKVWDGKVQTLRHFKDEVKEVTGQQECGVCFANFEGFQTGDIIECYALEELPRSL